MPFDIEQTALRDMRYHIDLAAHFVAGFDSAAFCDDLRTVYAVTRCLEIISEASRRLSDALKERHPYTKLWQPRPPYTFTSGTFGTDQRRGGLNTVTPCSLCNG
jgi:hypothetical protein